MKTTTTPLLGAASHLQVATRTVDAAQLLKTAGPDKLLDLSPLPACTQRQPSLLDRPCRAQLAWLCLDLLLATKHRTAPEKDQIAAAAAAPDPAAGTVCCQLGLYKAKLLPKVTVPHAAYRSVHQQITGEVDTNCLQ